MILLADEPTAELDSESSARVLEAFRAVNREFGMTIVMVTHDLAAARAAVAADPRPRRAGAARRPGGRSDRRATAACKLPDDAIAALGEVELEAEVGPDEVRLRRRSETGHA